MNNGKKRLLTCTLTACILGSVCGFAHAETINYHKDGDYKLNNGDLIPKIEQSGNLITVAIVDKDKNTKLNSVSGGSSEGGAASGNTLTITGEKTIITGSVTGGYSMGNSATGNTVTVQNGATVTASVYGGSSDSGAVTGNSVVIDNSAVGNDVNISDVYGGFSGGGAVSNNKVTVQNGAKVESNVYGGSSVIGAVTGNSVTVQNGATVTDSVYGGFSRDKAVTGNSVTIDNATVDQGVYGGKSTSGAVSDNSVVIDNSAVGNGDVYGGSSRGGAVSNNTVTVTGTNTSITGTVFGGFSISGEVSGNSVTIKGATVGGTVSGGKSSNTGVVSGNTVTVTGTDTSITGSVEGGESESGAVSGNSVTVQDGTNVTGDVYGGYSLSGAVSDNTVTIKGATVGGKIYGGYVNNDPGNATGNTVTIGDYVQKDGSITQPTLGTATNNTTEIYGGFNNATSTNGDVFTGNTFNIGSVISVNKIANFQNYNITIPAGLKADETMVTTANAIDLSGKGIDIKDKPTVAIVGINGSYDWSNKSATIFNSVTNSDNAKLEDGDIRQGLTYKYEAELSFNTNKKLQVTFVKKDVAKVADEAKSLSEGRAASLGFVNMGADLLSGAGLDNAQAAGKNGATFAAISYGKNKMDTGSYADIKGTSVVAGAARNISTDNAETLIGGFIEAGWGRYNTFNSFAEGGNITASGDTNYYGIGILAKRTVKSGLYTEASLRVGRVDNKYNSADLSAFISNEAKYDFGSTYYGLHLGVGKKIRLNPKNELDIYGKYFWLHQSGATVNVGIDQLEFAANDSHRIRIGAKLHHDNNKTVASYLGLAYEYEFAGTIKAKANGQSVLEPSAKGSTAIMELGLNFKPAQNDKFTIGAGVQGYVGERKGLSGNLQFKWQW